MTILRLIDRYILLDITLTKSKVPAAWWDLSELLVAKESRRGENAAGFRRIGRIKAAPSQQLAHDTVPMENPTVFQGTCSHLSGYPAERWRKG
jgi:hypothetical protein